MTCWTQWRLILRKCVHEHMLCACWGRRVCLCVCMYVCALHVCVCVCFACECHNLIMSSVPLLSLKVSDPIGDAKSVLRIIWPGNCDSKWSGLPTVCSMAVHLQRILEEMVKHGMFLRHEYLEDVCRSSDISQDVRQVHVMYNNVCDHFHSGGGWTPGLQTIGGKKRMWNTNFT